jgi:hypothetical protein
LGAPPHPRAAVSNRGIMSVDRRTSPRQRSDLAEYTRGAGWRKGVWLGPFSRRPGHTR